MCELLHTRAKKRSGGGRGSLRVKTDWLFYRDARLRPLAPKIFGLLRSFLELDVLKK